MDRLQDLLPRAGEISYYKLFYLATKAKVTQDTLKFLPNQKQFLEF